MIFNLNNETRWLFCCLVFFTASCKHASDDIIQNVPLHFASTIDEGQILKKLDSIALMIRPGDIVTRTGNDFTSQSLKTLNRTDKTFSHCGIANIENDSVIIYHAIGGEWNPDEKLKRESFKAFSNPQYNVVVGVYRMEVANSFQKKIVAGALALYRLGTKFDMDFNLLTDDKMYCSEFVSKILNTASHNQIIIKHSFINQFEFVGIDEIIHHSKARNIAFLNYRL